MELSFITKAVRRYWWVVVVFLALAIGAVFASKGNTTPVYESNALLFLAPPDDGSGSTSADGGSDRYLVGEIVVLQSRGLAETVSKAVPGTTPDEVSASATFTQIVGSSVVRIFVRYGSAVQAQEIADQYATAYINQAVANAKLSTAPQSQELNDKLTSLQKQLDDVNAEVVQALAPYRPAGPIDPTRIIPSIDSLNPGLASERTSLQVQVASIQQQINNIRPTQVRSTIVQRATLPDAPAPAGRSLLVLISPIVAVMLGAVAAVVLAQISPRVLDDEEVAEILEAPVAGVLPKSRLLKKRARPPLERVPSTIAPLIGELCVRAEAMVPTGETGVIVVVGSERSSGSTTVAAAMANRYAFAGAKVLLIDANSSHPTLTQFFGAGGMTVDTLANMAPPSVTTLNGTTGTAAQRRLARVDDPAVFGSSVVPGLGVVGLSKTTNKSGSLRREDLPQLLENASNYAQIVVFDGGPLLDSAFTVQLASVAHAVILVVPTARQHTRSLEVVSGQLHARRDVLLTVCNPAASNRRRNVGSAVSVDERTGRPTTEPARRGLRGLTGLGTNSQRKDQEPTLQRQPDVEGEDLGE